MNQTTVSKIMTKQDLQEYLNCSLAKVNTLMKDYSLPFYKIGRSVRYDLNAVTDWLEQFENKRGA